MKLLLNNQWGKERDAEAFPFLPASLPPAACSSSPRGSARLTGGRLRAEGGRQPLRPCPGSAGSLCRAAPGACGSGSEPGRWRCLASCQRLLRSFAVTLLPHGRHFKVLAAGRCAVRGVAGAPLPGRLSLAGKASPPNPRTVFFSFSSSSSRYCWTGFGERGEGF